MMMRRGLPRLEQPPRPREQAILRRLLPVWLVTSGLVTAVGTLGIITWANSPYDRAVVDMSRDDLRRWRLAA
jgi:hypothetical protein